MRIEVEGTNNIEGSPIYFSPVLCEVPEMARGARKVHHDATLHLIDDLLVNPEKMKFRHWLSPITFNGTGPFTQPEKVPEY